MNLSSQEITEGIEARREALNLIHQNIKSLIDSNIITYTDRYNHPVADFVVIFQSTSKENNVSLFKLMKDINDYHLDEQELFRTSRREEIVNFWNRIIIDSEYDLAKESDTIELPSFKDISERTIDLYYSYMCGMSQLFIFA